MSDQSGTSDVIRLGYHGSPLVADRIVEAAGDHGHEVRLSQYDVTDPFRALRNGELDVMISRFVVDEPDLANSRELATESRVVVVSADHPLAERESVSVEELADYDAFDRPGSMPSYVWDQVVPPTTPSGRPIHRRHQVSTASQMMALVGSTDAVHLTVDSLADIAPASIRLVPIHDLPPASVFLTWCRDRDAKHVRVFVDGAESALAR